ncbi:SRPBCC family protein [Cytophaga aurantiaca]|uniref:SRPBCC family protein n=1 Tax=Cytophaga aurantiaca TaxID=29530 RepID=UPI00037ADD80|nr:SRPBCC domain-containing protein [Cytophaga aurantiaca]
MEDTVLVVERTFKASVSVIWNALTNKDEMKKWYFDLKEFKAEIGFTFEFVGGPPDGIQYTHVCKVTEVIVEQKLTYSWRYEGYEGISFVTFELFDKGNETLLRLTHTGIETFPKHPDFARTNFAAGWDHIINTSLKGYLEN